MKNLYQSSLLLTRKNFLVPEQKPYICGNCGIEIMGGRYNNHCPQCLWSKHIDDKIPGDKSSDCQGMMKPVGVFQKKGNGELNKNVLSVIIPLLSIVLQKMISASLLNSQKPLYIKN